jgi:putative peptidoglycan lipid II flippase
LLSLRMIVFLTVPASIGLITLGEPLIRLFFERGEFTRASTHMTAFALQFYALGLLGHATVEIVDRVFYAFHDTWTPVKVAVGAILGNIILSLTLMNTPLNYGGLALANAIAATAEGGTLIWILSRRLQADGSEGIGLRQLGDNLGRMVAAALIMGVTTVLLRDLLFERIALAATVELSLVVLLCTLAGAAVYFLLARLLRVQETLTLWSLFRGRV